MNLIEFLFHRRFSPFFRSVFRSVLSVRCKCVSFFLFTFGRCEGKTEHKNKVAAKEKERSENLQTIKMRNNRIYSFTWPPKSFNFQFISIYRHQKSFDQFVRQLFHNEFNIVKTLTIDWIVIINDGQIDESTNNRKRGVRTKQSENWIIIYRLEL